MTVAELLAKLGGYPPDKYVMVDADWGAAKGKLYDMGETLLLTPYRVPGLAEV